MQKWRVDDSAQGDITRGKTARNRLRRVDLFVTLAYPNLLRQLDGVYVDLGYGEMPYTVLESAARFHAINPQLPIIGVEIDPARVTAAQSFANEQIEFRLGGFVLPLSLHEKAHLIRAFNVLRQYEEESVADIHRRLIDQLMPGGLLIEGTSNPHGRVWCANLFHKQEDGSVRQGLLFSTNFKSGSAPGLFPAVLPKNFIHRMVPGEPIHTFFQAWQHAYRHTMPFTPLGPRQHWAATAAQLSRQGYTIVNHPKLLRQGFMLWWTGDHLRKSTP